MTEHSANSPEVSSSSSSDYTSAPTEGLLTLDQLHDGKSELKQEGQSEASETETTPPTPTASPATGATLTAAGTTQTTAPATAQAIPQTQTAPASQAPGGK